MSDTRRRYRAIYDGLMQALHHPTGHQASHVQTLALLICGMLGAMHSHLPRIATHAPALGRLRSSLIQRFTNWYRNHVITREVYYNPVITPLLVGLATSHTALRVVLDGSAVGTNMVVLMANVIYRGRSIPIAWKVVRGKKGHVPTWVHLDVLHQVHAVVPSWASVIGLGDGEFDGPAFLQTIGDYRWSFVCRTAKTTVVWHQGIRQHCQDMPVQRDRPVVWAEAEMTRRPFGKVHIIAYWDTQEQEPIYLVTNIEHPTRALRHDQRRAVIETFFSDQKSRGFRIERSHLRDPERLTRLLIAFCLAYLWTLYLGVVAYREGWVKCIHRGDRSDLSLFQLGLRLLSHLLDEELPIPIGFIVLDVYELGDIHNGEQTFVW